MSIKETDPSLINTSYMILFHLSVVASAFIFAATFSGRLHGFALGINLLYGVGIFWFFYLLRQFQDENAVLAFILIFFSISAVLGFISALKGPLTNGEVPVLGISFINQKIISWGAQTSFMYASVLIAYGYITYVTSVAAASVAEFLYVRVFSKALPAPFKRKFLQADKSIDALSSNFSTNFFFMNQRRGIQITAMVVLGFACMYVTLLAFG